MDKKLKISPLSFKLDNPFSIFFKSMLPQSIAETGRPIKINATIPAIEAMMALFWI